MSLKGIARNVPFEIGSGGLYKPLISLIEYKASIPENNNNGLSRFYTRFGGHF